MSNSLYFRDYKPDQSTQIISLATEAVKSPSDSPGDGFTTETGYAATTTESYDAAEIGQTEAQGSFDDLADSGVTRYSDQAGSVMPTVAPKVQFPDPESLPPPPAASALEVVVAVVILVVVVFGILALLKFGGTMGVAALGFRLRQF